LNGWNISSVSHVKISGVISGNRTTWRLHIEMIEANVFRKFIRIYSLFQREPGYHIGIATDYGLDDLGIRVGVPVGARSFSSLCYPGINGIRGQEATSPWKREDSREELREYHWTGYREAHSWIFRQD
jgi:hypothetical protein